MAVAFKGPSHLSQGLPALHRICPGRFPDVTAPNVCFQPSTSLVASIQGENSRHLASEPSRTPAGLNHPIFMLAATFLQDNEQASQRVWAALLQECLHRDDVLGREKRTGC